MTRATRRSPRQSAQVSCHHYQHRDDQAETLLFRLLWGAGVRGLTGMPAQRSLGGGHLMRPLLEVSRAELETYAREQQLSWIEDPLQRRPTLFPELPAPSCVSRNYGALAPGRE